MNIIKDTCSSYFEIDACQDPEEVLDYTVFYSLVDRQASTEYFLNDVVFPTDKSGIYLECVQPGITGSTAPTISTKKGSKATDGTVIWKTIYGKMSLQDGETVSASSWVSDLPTELTHTGVTGTLSVGDEVEGADSGATGIVYSTPTETMLLVNDISGTFQAETVAGDGGSISVSVVGSILGTLATPTNNDYSATIWLGPIDERITSIILTNSIQTTSSPIRYFDRSIKININHH